MENDSDFRDFRELRDELVTARKMACWHPGGFWMTPVPGAAVLLGLQPKTLYNRRDNGQPPESFTYDGTVYYSLETIAAYRRSGTPLPCADATSGR